MQKVNEEEVKSLVEQSTELDVLGLKHVPDEYFTALGKFVAKLHDAVYVNGCYGEDADPSIAVEVAAILAFMKK